MAETVIRRVEPSDGPLVKSLRLRALETDPTSFASTHGREAAYSDEEWDDWAAGDATGDVMATMIAFRGGIKPAWLTWISRCVSRARQVRASRCSA